VKQHPRLGNSLHRAPRTTGSIPADLVAEVAEYMNYSPVERTVRAAKKNASAASEWLRGAILGAPTSAERTLKLGREFAVELAEITKEHGPELAKKAAQKATEQAKATISKLPGQVQQLWSKAS